MYKLKLVEHPPAHAGGTDRMYKLKLIEHPPAYAGGTDKRHG